MKARIIAKLVAAGHEDLAEQLVEAAVYDHNNDVLDFRAKVDGGSKPIDQLIREYLLEVIAGGQKLHKIVDKTVKFIEREYYNGEEQTDYRKLREAVRKEVNKTWGNDPMTKLWAEAIVDGKYLF